MGLTKWAFGLFRAEHGLEDMRQARARTLLFTCFVFIAVIYNVGAKVPSEGLFFGNLEYVAQHLQQLWQSLRETFGVSGQPEIAQGQGANSINLSEDVSRVTFSNIFIVTTYAFWMLVWTRNLSNDGRRKWYDTIYFFGFILTILALIVTLGDAGRFDIADVKSVVVHGAIAMSTTGIALFLRTCFVTLIRSRDLEENSWATLEAEIAGTRQGFIKLRRTVGGLDGTLENVGSSISEVIERFEISVSGTAESLEKQANSIAAISIDEEKLRDEIAKAATAALNGTKSELETLQAVIMTLADADNGSLIQLDESLKTGAASVADSINDVSGRITAIDVPKTLDLDLQTPVEALLETQLREIGTQLKDQIETLKEPLQSYRETLNSSDQSQQKSYEKIAAALAELDARVDSLSKLDEALATIMNRLDNSALSPIWQEAQTESLKNVTEALHRSVQVMEQIRPKPTFSRVRKFIDRMFRRSAAEEETGG